MEIAAVRIGAPDVSPTKKANGDSRGKSPTPWENSDTIKTDVIYILIKDKNPCQVVDCAFHPDSFQFAAAYSSFQAMMISIALESAERQLGERK